MPKRVLDTINLVHIHYTFLMPRPPKPGGVVIEPRSYTDNAKKFGRTNQRLTNGPINTPQHAAAELQHALSNTIREHLLEEGRTLKAFCENTALPPGLSFERISRIANGTTMMGLTDLMFWAAHIPEFTNTIHQTIQTISTVSTNPTPNPSPTKPQQPHTAANIKRTAVCTAACAASRSENRRRVDTG